MIFKEEEEEEGFRNTNLQTPKKAAIIRKIPHSFPLSHFPKKNSILFSF